MPGEFEKLLQCGCPVTNLSVNEPPTWGKPVTIHDNQGFWGNKMNTTEIFAALSIPSTYSCPYSGGTASTARSLETRSPIDLGLIGKVECTSLEGLDRAVTASTAAFTKWRTLPAPQRGELVRQFGLLVRELKQPLAELVTLETGKILSEALGEIQEVIDIADFAVGLSRQLYGLTMHSERAEHRMYEQWHPLGPVGVISAFNFPAAVWAWNAMIAAVCGDTVIWKPSEQTPFIAITLTQLANRVTTEAGHENVFVLVNGEGSEIGAALAADVRLPLISATGSCRMGRSVAATVAARFGRSLLELGGNNAVIVLADANLDLALRAVLFGAVGTAGQRCTTTRRLLIDRKVKEPFVVRLLKSYAHIPIGDPRDPKTLMGPLINDRAVAAYQSAVTRAASEGGVLRCGGTLFKGAPSPLYVEPTIIELPRSSELLREETFAPILYVVEVDGVDDAIALNNEVPQGLSSALFTESLRASERFLSCRGSDCGIANVNIGTSGAEIGGAFGGEKDTGGGREAGSDSWKAYMRRQTNTVNWGDALPLAQGVRFDVA